MAQGNLMLMTVGKLGRISWHYAHRSRVSLFLQAQNARWPLHKGLQNMYRFHRFCRPEQHRICLNYSAITIML